MQYRGKRKCLNAGLIGAGVFVVLSLLTSSAPASEVELLARFDAAIKSQDPKPVFELMCREGCSDRIKARQTNLVTTLLNSPIKSRALVSWPADVDLEDDFNGVHYGWNIPVLGMLKVSYVTAGQTEPFPDSKTDKLELTDLIPYGKTNGVCFLAGGTERKSELPLSEQKPLTLSVSTTSLSNEPVSFQGECVFLRAGKEFRRSFSGKQSLSKAFIGGSFKYCLVSTAVTNHPVELTLREGSEQIFSAKGTNSLVSYEANPK